MNTVDPLDELLEARLREETLYVDDDGFTARVLQQLPARPHSFQLERSIIIFAAALISVVVAYFASGEGMFVREAFVRLTSLPFLQLLSIVIACAFAILVASACAAFAAREHSG